MAISPEQSDEEIEELEEGDNRNKAQLYSITKKLSFNQIRPTFAN
jgi:hypothetical protein